MNMEADIEKFVSTLSISEGRGSQLNYISDEVISVGVLNRWNEHDDYHFPIEYYGDKNKIEKYFIDCRERAALAEKEKIIKASLAAKEREYQNYLRLKAKFETTITSYNHKDSLLTIEPSVEGSYSTCLEGK